MGRHGDPEIPGGERDGPLGVQPFVRVDELLEQRTLLRARLVSRPFRAFKLDVMRMEAGLIAEVTVFNAELFPAFGLLPTL